MLQISRFLSLGASAAVVMLVGAGVANTSYAATNSRLIVNSTDLGVLSDQSPSFIDSDGNLRVVLENGSASFVPAALSIPSLSLTRSGSGGVAAGSSVNVQWSVNGSNTCRTAGGTAAWRSTSIAGSGSGNFQINNTSIFELLCSNSAGLASTSLEIPVSAPLAPPAVSVTGPSSVVTGSSATINYSVSNVLNGDNCTFSSNPANAAWNSRAIVTSGGFGNGSASLTLNTTGNNQFSLSCTEAGQSGSDAHTVNVGSSPPATISSFTLNGSSSASSVSVASGSTVNLSATISQATSCTLSTTPAAGVTVVAASGSTTWTGSVGNGTITRSVVVTNSSSATAGNVSFSVTCNPGNVSLTRSAAVQPIASAACSGISAPVGTFRDNNRTSLANFFGNNAQWGTGISVTTQEFAQNQYVSLQFTPSVATGEVSWSVGSGNTGSFRVRVSECANDFRTRTEAPGDIQYCVLNPPADTSGLIRTRQTGSAGWQCPITPGQNYFLNILLESCPVSSCFFYGTLREWTQ